MRPCVLVPDELMRYPLTADGRKDSAVPARQETEVAELPYMLAAVATLIAGSFVWKRKGVLAGLAAGLGTFVVLVLLLVSLGFGY